MKKFSKLYEGKDNLLSKLGTSEDELRDICIDLIDENYKLVISTKYIGLDGRSYYNTTETSKYYPTIEIDLHRELQKNSETGEMYDGFSDVRMWDGGVYYEGNIETLKLIYEICYRIQSTFNSDDSKVYFSLRNINEVKVRITFALEESKSPISFHELKDFIEERLSYEDDDYNGSYIGGSSNNFRIEINPKNSNSQNYNREFIERLLEKDGNDNEYLKDIVFIKIIKNLLKFCQKSNHKIYLGDYQVGNSGEVYLMFDSKQLVRISYSFFDVEPINIIVSKGIFKNKTKKVTIQGMDINVKFLREEEEN